MARINNEKWLMSNTEASRDWNSSRRRRSTHPELGRLSALP